MTKLGFRCVCASLVLTAATGCGMMKNMDEMKDRTTQMSETTDKMAQTTSSMAKTTNGMAKDVNFTYLDLRIGNTRQARQDALRAMGDSDDIATKMGYASEYFAAMEYQFWKPDIETPRDREDLMTLAVKDFFKKVREYISNESNASATNEDPGSQNLYALAATLHYVNNAQTAALSSMGERPAPQVTMLSMLEDGLRMKSALEAGKIRDSDLPPYQLEVLRQEQIAVYVLRVRQNFLKAFGFMLSASSEDGQEPSKSKLKAKYLGAKLFGKTWTPNFDVRNPAQINYNAIIFEYAAETLGFLKKQGYDPYNDKIIGTFLAKMDVDTAAENASGVPAKSQAIARFKAAVGLLLQ